MLASGTKANIFLWDLRSSATLGVLKEFHQEPVTQLQFHPELSKGGGYPVLFSGGDDSLICQFNLNTTDLDETLENVLSVEQPVGKMGFFGTHNEYVFCLSQVETLTLWDIEHAQKVADFPDIRDQLSVAAKRARPSITIDYLVTCLYHPIAERLFLVAGTSNGDLALCHVNKNDVQLCSLNGSKSAESDREKKKNGSSIDGHTDIIRDCVLLHSHLLTGSQDGRICVWGSLPSSSSTSPISDLLSSTTESKKK